MLTNVHVLLCHSKSCLELVNLFITKNMTDNTSCTKRHTHVLHALTLVRDDVMHAGTILPFRKQDLFRLTWWTNWFNFWGGVLFCVGYVMIFSHGNQ